MFTIRQVLRLYASGRGTKYISQSTGVARNTVKKYLLRFILAQKTLEQIESMSDAQMSRLFLVKERIEVVDKRSSDLESLLPSLGYAKKTWCNQADGSRKISSSMSGWLQEFCIFREAQSFYAGG